MQFKALKGRRILIEKPERPKSVIELTPEQEAMMDSEFISKWTKLTVYAVGEDVDGIKAGDQVYVPGGALQSSEIVPFEDKHYIMINEFDVAIVW
jgi:predicted nuclease of restriction endonuclease-like RecB superfamily